MNESLIPRHGGYRRLKSFRVAQLVYDVTVRFCDRYVDRFSRTRDQMIQAARSGVQNIAEGSQASATSKKTEIKLTQVARASLEELKLDYEDFLRQRGLTRWARNDPRRQRIIDSRPGSAEDVAVWVRAVHAVCMDDGSGGRCDLEPSSRSTSFTGSTPSTYPEISANGALALIDVARALLNRQVERLAADFEQQGGFTERLYRTRTARQAR